MLFRSEPDTFPEGTGQGINPSVARAPLAPPDPPSVVALEKMKDRIQSEIQRYRGARTDPQPQRPQHMSDFTRLVRRICGKSIGVVAVAHMVSCIWCVLWHWDPRKFLTFSCRGQGVLCALEEYGIPVDHVRRTCDHVRRTCDHHCTLGVL